MSGASSACRSDVLACLRVPGRGQILSNKEFALARPRHLRPRLVAGVSWELAGCISGVPWDISISLGSPRAPMGRFGPCQGPSGRLKCVNRRLSEHARGGTCFVLRCRGGIAGLVEPYRNTLGSVAIPLDRYTAAMVRLGVVSGRVRILGGCLELCRRVLAARAPSAYTWAAILPS